MAHHSSEEASVFSRYRPYQPLIFILKMLQYAVITMYLVRGERDGPGKMK